MRLVDILVEHLATRGGWPPGVDAITQSAIDGEIYMHKRSDGELTARGAYFLQVAEDCRKPVRREDYEKNTSISSRKRTEMQALRDSYVKFTQGGV